MTIEFSIAEKAVRRVVAELEGVDGTANEAQTRFSFIDLLLTDCLGWSRDQIKVEVFENGDRSDYECGSPRQLIVEAKRPGVSFSFPPRSVNSHCKIKIKSLMMFNQSTKEGIEQVCKYCQERGVPVAALCNGPQLIIFLAVRLDGQAPMDGDAFVYDSYDSLIRNFNTVYESLSPDGIREKRLSQLLGASAGGALPAKLSSACLNYYEYKYSSVFQENLKNASSLVIEDIGKTAEVEADFLRECYCESGPLSQYSLVGKNILSARYASLFSSSEIGSRIEDVNPKKRSGSLNEKIVAEAIARRPIVLLGDVGVGKTSFIKNLTQIQGKKEFGESLLIYFDLGARGALSLSTRDALLHQIENTLRVEQKVNLQDSKLLEGMYRQQLFDFDHGFVGQLKETQPQLFQQKRIEYLQTLVSEKSSHLRLCLDAVAKEKKCQVIIIIDNADQRDIEIQQEAFVIAHELASTWNALVFLSLRPQTFHNSKRSGTISAYPPKVFVIPPPKLEDAIEKRLTFAHKIADGRLSVTKVKDLSMHIESLAILIRALQNSLHKNKELYEFIVNVSAGNVRVAIELISKFIGNPNVESERIVQILTEGGGYIIPLHEFAKGGLLGDYAYFQEDSSYACNIFSVIFADKREHFLSLMILGYLGWDGALREQVDGFIGVESVFHEMQTNGFTQDQTTAHLKKLTRKKLIETTERRLLETEKEIQDIGMPEAFRITSLGAYHLKRWIYDFSFLEAMCFDTPIFSNQIVAQLSPRINDQALSARYERATIFRQYLDAVWQDLNPKPYFDWAQFKTSGDKSFERVTKRLADNAGRR